MERGQRELVPEIDVVASFAAFRDRYLVAGEGGCLEWRGAAHERGYGRLRFRGKVRSAHRVAWSLARGQEVPDYTLIRHLCANPPCCNPEHLRLGTSLENARDKSPRRGRAGLDEQIVELRRKVAHGHESVARLERRLSRALLLRESLAGNLDAG